MKLGIGELAALLALALTLLLGFGIIVIEAMSK